MPTGAGSELLPDSGPDESFSPLATCLFSMTTRHSQHPVPTAVEELLTGDPVVAHLATCADGRPHSAPLWFRYEDGVIEIVTTGVKLANIRQNPYVSMSMEKDSAGIPEWMVTVRGTATIVEDEAEIRRANTRINRRYGVDDESWPENVLVRIDIGSVSYTTY